MALPPAPEHDLDAGTSRSRFTVRRVVSTSLLLLLVLFLAAAFLLPARRGGRSVGPDESCERRLEDIHSGLIRYRAEHPDCPPYVVGPQGDPHSWRIVVAQYIMEEQADHRFQGYRFEEPWDSPHNQEVVRWSPLLVILRCIVEEGFRRDYPFASYLMLVRPEAERAAQSLSPKAVIVVESAQCRIEYAEPRDIAWASLWEGPSPFGLGKLHSLHPTIVRALCNDGTIIEIPKDLDADRLKLLLEGKYQLPSKWWRVGAIVLSTVLGCALLVLLADRLKRGKQLHRSEGRQAEIDA